MKRAVVLASVLIGLTLSACGSSGITTSNSAASSSSTTSAGDPATDHLAEILARGTLVLSTDPGYPPQSFAVKGAQRLTTTKCAETR